MEIGYSLMLSPIPNDQIISQYPRNTVTPFSHFLIPFSSDKNGGGGGDHLNLKPQILGRKFILECCTLLFAKYGHFFLVLSVHLKYARAGTGVVSQDSSSNLTPRESRICFRYLDTGNLSGRHLRKSLLGSPWRWQDISNSYSRLVKVQMTANQ